MSDERLIRDLHAYRDGELRGWRAWGVRRRLARDSRARAELAGLEQIGAVLRAQAEEAPAPDLWSQIVVQLPAAAPAAGATGSARAGWRLPQWAAAGVFFLMPPAPPEAAAPSASAILMLDTGRRPAFILQDDGEATIIWLLQMQKVAAGREQDGVG